MKLSLAILLLSSLPAFAQFGAQAVSAGRWEPRNYATSLGCQLLFCSYWTNGILLNGETVSYWTNRLGNGFNLTQGTEASQPKWTNDAPWGGYCLYFDGSNDSMSVACAAMVQPTVVIWGGRQVTWTSLDQIWAGLGIGATSSRMHQEGTSPSIRLYAGSGLVLSDTFSLGEWGVITSVLNGNSSSITKNKGTPSVGSAGPANPVGVNLAGAGTAFGNTETFGLLVMTNTSAAATNYARLGFLGMAGTK